MSISGRTPSKSGDTGPPVFGRADAEAVALAVELAVAVALMLADALLLADALDIALAEDGALDIALAEDGALDIALAEDEALDIMLSSPIIMFSSPICCAIATAAKANTATRHRAANNRIFLKMPPSVDFPHRGIPAPFPGGSMLGRLQRHRQCTNQDLVVESPTITTINHE
jgi:hypothetical protein